MYNFVMTNVGDEWIDGVIIFKNCHLNNPLDKLSIFFLGAYSLNNKYNFRKCIKSVTNILN